MSFTYECNQLFLSKYAYKAFSVLFDNVHRSGNVYVYNCVKNGHAAVNVLPGIGKAQCSR